MTTNFYITSRPEISSFWSSVKPPKPEEFPSSQRPPVSGEPPDWSTLPKSPKSRLHNLGAAADRYLNFSGKEVFWTCHYINTGSAQGDSTSQIAGWTSSEKCIHVKRTCLKVLSYATLIFPLIALVVKAIYRYKVIRPFEASLCSFEEARAKHQNLGLRFLSNIEHISLGWDKHDKLWANWLVKNDFIQDHNRYKKFVLSFFEVHEQLKGSEETRAKLISNSEGNPFITATVLAESEALKANLEPKEGENRPQYLLKDRIEQLIKKYQKDGEKTHSLEQCIQKQISSHKKCREWWPDSDKWVGFFSPPPPPQPPPSPRPAVVLASV